MKKQQAEDAPTAQTSDKIVGMFHSGKVLRPQSHGSSSEGGGYWKKRTEKLIKQQQSTKETLLSIYSGGINLLNPSPSGEGKENKNPNETEQITVNQHLFKGLVFFLNSIRGDGIHSQFHLSKLATVHGAVIL